VGGTAAVAVQAARAIHLGPVSILGVASLVAAVVVIAASKSKSEVILGTHGAWASRYAEEFFRRGYDRLGRLRGSNADDLAEVNSK